VRLLSAIAYHGFSLLALLVHLYLAIIVAVTVIPTVPPGMELPGLLLKLVVVAGWVALLAFGLLQWLRRRWLVFGVPFIALVSWWGHQRDRVGLDRLVSQVGLLRLSQACSAAQRKIAMSARRSDGRAPAGATSAVVRKVRAPQRRVAGNARPPQGEDQCHSDDAARRREPAGGVKRANSTRSKAK
jgi:hypothetical protein